MRELTYTAAAREALTEAMARDPSIFVVGEGIGPRGGNFNTTLGLHELHGTLRLRDTPISERGFVGLCGGAAMTGARPVVDLMFMDFGLDALGEMLNQISKMQYMSSGRLKMPIVLRACIGVGNSAATHHSGSYYPFFVHIPGFRVALPSTPRDARGLLATALRSDDPVVFLEHRALLNTKGPVPDEMETIPFGQAAVARPGGADCRITVVALSVMARKALEACDQLAAEGVPVEVIDPRTLAPLDIQAILDSVHRTGRLLIVDETYAPCGIGAEIAAQVTDLAFDDLDAPVRRLNGAHTPIPYSPPLEAAVVPDTAAIARAIRDLLAE
jgi:2-oxoisovalerate dehydrogenase E1 component